ncbi:MAG: hypothetical protein C0625_15405 [Arcobacter sp.]|nr:MAG: hypothetical protein C0625_15405 [Arcobacter sp.]
MTIVPLNFNDNEVRTVMDDNGEPLFNAKDVCNILELENVSRAISKLDEEDLTLLKVTSGGQKRDMNYVTESGLYHLIFSSYKEEARVFKRWVTKEVLPSIRKTGSYSLFDGDMQDFHKIHRGVNPNASFTIEFKDITATAYCDKTYGFLITGSELAKLMEVEAQTLRVLKLYHKDIIKENDGFIYLGQTTYYTKKGVEIASIHNRKGDFAQYVHSGRLQLQISSKISNLLSA